MSQKNKNERKRGETSVTSFLCYEEDKYPELSNGEREGKN
jgi:hypothetical protein